MRHNNNNRNRNRNRGGGHFNNGGQRRGPVSLRQQNFDSNGPDVRIRGTAWQVCEKYQALAKDAASSGDYIMAENYAQHAEHYQRMINEYNEQMGIVPQQPGDEFASDTDQSGEGGNEAGEDTTGNSEQQNAERPERSERNDRGERNDRSDRNDRGDRGDRNQRPRRERYDNNRNRNAAPADAAPESEGAALRRAQRPQNDLPDADDLGLPANLFGGASAKKDEAANAEPMPDVAAG